VSWCSSQSQLSDKHLFCSSIHVVIVLAFFGTSCSDAYCCSACTASSRRHSVWHFFCSTIEFLRNSFHGMSGGWIPTEIPNWYIYIYNDYQIDLMHRMVDESKYIMLIQTIVTDYVHMWCYICGLWVVMSINYKFKYRAQNTMNTSWYVQFIRTQTFNECSQ